MHFQAAYSYMKRGHAIALPEWGGYWVWDGETIIMCTRKGDEIDLRDTNNLDYTLSFMFRDDWELVHPEDTEHSKALKELADAKPGFEAYQGKPVIRHAYRVVPGDVIESVGEATYRIQIAGQAVEFKAYEPVSTGDYIVHLSDDDIYHCRANVFHERNVVEG